MEALLRDIRQAVRMLARSPAFTLVAIATLALGIGANTAIFSVVNAVLLQPLPYSQPDRLVRLTRKFLSGDNYGASIPKFMAWKNNTQAFQYICAYDFAGPGLNISGAGAPEQVKAIHVSADYFPVFDAVPAVGRAFSAAEDRPGGPPVAVMSHGLWVRRFGGDLKVIGRPITLNGEPYTIIGVLRASFRSYPPADLLLPLQADPNTTSQAHYLSVVARLKPGATLEAARAQMEVAAERFRQSQPTGMENDESANAIPFAQSLVGDVRRPLLIFFGAVGLVLLIACANVANLLLARATGRAREIAIRTALGAGRWRIVRQLLTESLVLALAGGLAGMLLGAWGARVLMALRPANFPRVQELADANRLDGRILLFTVGTALVTGILFGLVPALQIPRSNVNSTLKESGSGPGTRRHHYARSTLAVVETTLAVILLIGAALLIRTFASLREVNAGFNPSHVLTFETSLAGAKYSTTASVARLIRDLVRRTESIPGVKAVASVPFLPLEGAFGLGFDIVGRPLGPGGQSAGGAMWMYVSESYFQALEIPLRRGRVFTPQDTAGAPLVVIINESFAKKYWPNQDPVSQRIIIARDMGPDFAEGPREVIGIVGDVKEGGLGNPAPEVMYIPVAQLKDNYMALHHRIFPMAWVVKTRVNPLALSQEVRKQVLAADGQLAVSHERPLDQVVSEATARQSFNMTLLSVFAAIALLLAAIGIYGTLSYSVQQRAREIGIRMALGADAGDVLRMVVRQGMILAGLGILTGLAGALGLTRLLASMLFGVTPNDPLTFVSIALGLAIVAFVACWIPARRAARVDPLVALRHE